MEEPLCDQDTQAKIKKAPYLPPCRVCGNAASGFHYGANTCEACKGFFRRSLSRQTPYSRCHGKCNIQKTGRLTCASCRYGKCLSIGMSKEAIKNGRYTHAKRTMDTLEIKYGSSSNSNSPSSGLTSPGTNSQFNSLTSSSSHQPLDLSAPRVGVSRPLSKGTDTAEQLLGVICNAFRVGFPSTAYLYDNSAAINRMVDSIMKERNADQLTDIISCTGSSATGKSVKVIETLTAKSQLMSSIETLNSSISLDLLWELPDYKLAYKELFEMWCTSLDKFIRDFVVFARQLPFFASLPIHDQTMLIKFGRAEAVTLVKFKHFHMRYKAVMHYEIETDTMILVPTRIMEMMVLGRCASDSDYGNLFRRALVTLTALDVTISDLAVMCALALLAPDRDELSEETRLKLSPLQEQLVRVLEVSLQRTRPTARRISAKFLLLLPMLRELNEYNKKELLGAQQRLDLQLSPLLQEVLHSSTTAHSTQDTPPEMPTSSSEYSRCASL